MLELGLRFFGYEGDFDRTHFVVDGRLGEVLRDSWVFSMGSEDANTWHIQGRAVPLHKSAGRQRILFLGDSGTAGLDVGPENSFPFQLERLLQGSGMPNAPEVINAGVVGMQPENELALWEASLWRLHPDTVVLGIFMANDINFILQSESQLYHAAFRWLRNHSALAHLVMLRLLALGERYGWRLAWAVPDQHGLSLLNYFSGEVATYRRTPSVVLERAWSRLRDVVQRLHQSTGSMGARLLVILIPSASSVAQTLHMGAIPGAEAGVAALGIRSGELDFLLPARRVSQICQDLGVTCIDPTASFSALGVAQTILPHDDHPTVEGHRLLAEALIPHLGFKVYQRGGRARGARPGE